MVQLIGFGSGIAVIIEHLFLIGKRPETSAYPSTLNTDALRALYDNLKDHVTVEQVKENSPSYGNGVPEDAAARIAVAVDTAIRTSKRADWRGSKMKQREVRLAIKRVLGNDDELVDMILELAMNQRDY
ncbi:hypothetical protein KFU94_57825 [Chloroflexi bacterium TSY]|nr:hypothetical protein [Chloroflexi bacterium TSY]